ncbi:class D sortase [Bacillus sp. DNRA2]|uniref:class D sortase n=1 Tax=Bacillus sp. DNRA2 TaxID=2723053 RepID=UPI00145D5821|nr:class D sortase [Bacillus sp. DNRA2]NMD69176.1 class D sortase [Bacillus sp. DNRA2]
MKKIGNLFILTGIVVLVFILYAKGKTYYEQKKLIEEYTSLSFSETAPEEKADVPAETGDMIGILEIPKIDLKTPMTEGAEPENIRYAVGHLPSSSSTNELGKKNKNFAIAGHRSYTYGKFFNRLDELENNDEVTIYSQNKVLIYRVFDKKIVKPSNVDVINPIEEKSIVTLITCHPEYSDKQRLIVFGELVSERKMDGSEIEKTLQQ